MAKKPHMHLELKERLDQQDQNIEVLNRTMNQILDLLKGSDAMNTPGIIKTFKNFEESLEDAKKRMEYFERWWEMQKMKKGTFTFKTANLLTRGLSLIGGVGTIAAIVYTVIQIIDWLKK